MAFDFPSYAANVRGQERASAPGSQTRTKGALIMPLSPSEILAELRQVKYDLSVTQTRVSDAIEHLAALNLADPDEPKCSQCGTRFRGPLSLAEHVYNSHDGPLPEHYLEAEKRAGLTADEPEPVPAGTYWTIPERKP